MTESALALYRKYRPASFAEVRDQEHIVSVLEGAIKKKQIPHALLFAGSRGTGKTTLARIFAREIGTSEIDLYEIDAASNRGIDDIRELKEAVHTLPYESARKVYIIDEVHMLTKEAFNALLKTLEEPPAHVVFILATTEEDKLLDTIKSRCQVFRFRAPSRGVLAKTVIDVAKKEGFKLKLEAADLIGVEADGLDLPAACRGKAFVHAEQVGGEQRGLVAAGAGADFEHRRALVGAVAREHGDGEAVLGLGQPLAQLGQLLVGQRLHFGIGGQRGQLGDLGAHLAHLARGLCDRLELGIVAARLDERLALERARSHARFELAKAALDLPQALFGNGHFVKKVFRTNCTDVFSIRSRI